MKLKSLLIETKVCERKFGEPLPTLDSVMEKHQGNSKPVNEAKGWDLLKNVYLKFTQHQVRRLELAIKNRDIKRTDTLVDLIIGGLSAAKKSTKRDRKTL